MIIEITRGHICLKVDNKTIRIAGEGLLSKKGQPNYIVYLNSIKKWDPPFDNEIIDEKTKEKIIEKIKVETKEKGLIVEFE